MLPRHPSRTSPAAHHGHGADDGDDALTPQIGDPQQAKIAQMMPLVFLFVFYNFAAALSLYYVINNFVSIMQIYRNLKKPLPDLEAPYRRKNPDMRLTGQMPFWDGEAFTPHQSHSQIRVRHQ